MIEDKVWSEDPTKYIIGADEVGRGSFAGPICAAAVKINYSHLALLTNVKDSKKLSAKKREEIFSMVEKNNIEYSFNESSNTFIDQFGIKNANEKVLTDSISDIYTGNEIVYVDHFKINDFKSISVVRGEDNSDISFEIEHSSGIAFVPSLSNKEAEYRLKKMFPDVLKIKSCLRA